MVCKQLKAAALVLMLQMVCLRPVRMQALGSILEAPVQATAPLGANTTFRCTAVGRIFWELDNVQILTEDLVAGQRGVDRFAPLSTVNHSEAVLTATLINNGTVVQCHVEELEVVGLPLLLNSSEEVSLLVFAEPSLPSNLMVNVPAMGLGVTLSWLPGFGIEGEEVNYIITSLEVATGNEVESQTNTTSVTLIPTSQESTCQSFRFIVRSQNLFSRSTLGLNSIEMLVPTVPLSVDSRSISVDVVLEMMPSLTISFDNLSPCGEYSVENYVLMFSEVDNDLGTLPLSVFNVSRSGSMKASISFMVTSADGLLLGKQYNVTVIASNTAGTSASVATTSTTGLQTVMVEMTSSSVVISCIFADGAAGLGCHVSFDDFFPGVNLTRVNGSDIVMANVPFPEELTGSALITVAEILCDGSVSSIKREAVIDIPPSTSLATIMADDSLIKWLGGLSAILAILLMGGIMAWVGFCCRKAFKDRICTSRHEPEVVFSNASYNQPEVCTFPNPSYDRTPGTNNLPNQEGSSIEEDTDTTSAIYEVIPENIGDNHHTGARGSEN